MQKGDVISVEVHERWVGKTHIVTRVTKVYDPEAVLQARRFMAECIARRLPQILVEQQLAEQKSA